MSFAVCPGEQKCLAMGRSAFFVDEPVPEPASSFPMERLRSEGRELIM